MGSLRSIGAALVLVILAGLLASCGEKEPESSQPAAATAAAVPGIRPNLIILLVDTLRADGVGFGGYDKPVTPRLDSWARRGVVFEQATTPSGWTKPAVVSLLTSLYPATHGVQDKDHVTPERIPMLAEVLRAQGYETAAYVTNFAVSEQFGLGQGFEIFRFFDKDRDAPANAPPQLNYVQAEHVLPEVYDFLNRPHPKPYFLYVHLTDPHFPYIPPAAHMRFGTSARGRYDGEVNYIDQQLGDLMSLLERTGQIDKSLIVLTADHGEEFREHGGTGHGVTVFEECVRVPLVVWAPSAVPGRRRAMVSLTDVAPTLLEGGRIPVPPDFGRQGRSFWRLVVGPEASGGWSWAYNELFFPTKGITFAYREGHEKVLYIERDYWGREDQLYLFDLANDPREQRSLAKTRPERLEELRGRLRAVRRQHLVGAVGSEKQTLGEDAIRRLRALGYIE